MFHILVFTFLLSISPFGEARAGIPYALLNNVGLFWAVLIGVIGNVMIYPIFIWLVDTFSKRFWPLRLYKRVVIYICKRAKKLAGNNVNKYGFWGLMVFVMIPLPGTGAYMGAIAAEIFNIERRKAFVAITIGVICSSIIVGVSTYLGIIGIEKL